MSNEPDRSLVAIAGNPNTGKTTLFNLLTGSTGKVGNYPGVTVERQIGTMRLDAEMSVRLMDVPGTYSLSARSAEEQLAIQAVAGIGAFEEPSLIVLVVEATQLTRNLYLALQVIELGMPVVIALNMIDRLDDAGDTIDAEALAKELGVPVVPITATKRSGLDELRKCIASVLRDPALGTSTARWNATDAKLLEDIREVSEAVPTDWYSSNLQRQKALALWSLLSIDPEDELDHIDANLRKAVANCR
ncbi:MAG: ferrous iron transport protein B, partial [Planctomycetota bacterium]